ncbi:MULTISPECIES: DUF1616 domain-containing protein [unclassified Methanosarcina]|nr:MULTISPECIES: DUF1616 domain-containing protein [unclassified Methanosarcina]
MKHTKILFILILISLTLFTSGCEERTIAEPPDSEEDSEVPEKLSLEEARQQASFEIITPEYLPDGYVFNYSIVYNNGNITPEDQDAKIVILNYQKGNKSFQIKETVYESKWEFGDAEITVYPDKLEENTFMEGTEKISINERDAKYLEGPEDLNLLQWELGGVEITLSGSLEKAEMLKIAESLDPYTEFYILGPEGTAENYPTDYVLGKSGTVIVGVVNHEYKPVNYTMEVRLEDTPLPLPPDQQYITLGDNETWEKAVTITPPFEGTEMTLGFLLYNEDEKNVLEEGICMPYRDLRLWINVSQNLSENISTPLTAI